jgi:tetratricopeptide (TPR) repeat protein
MNRTCASICISLLLFIISARGNDPKGVSLVADYDAILYQYATKRRVPIGYPFGAEIELKGVDRKNPSPGLRDWVHRIKARVWLDGKEIELKHEIKFDQQLVLVDPTAIKELGVKAWLCTAIFPYSAIKDLKPGKLRYQFFLSGIASNVLELSLFNATAKDDIANIKRHRLSILHSLGRYAESLTLLKKFEKDISFTNDPELWARSLHDVANSLRDSGRFDEAIAKLRQCCKLNPAWYGSADRSIYIKIAKTFKEVASSIKVEITPLRTQTVNGKRLCSIQPGMPIAVSVAMRLKVTAARLKQLLGHEITKASALVLKSETGTRQLLGWTKVSLKKGVKSYEETWIANADHTSHLKPGKYSLLLYLGGGELLLNGAPVSTVDLIVEKRRNKSAIKLNRAHALYLSGKYKDALTLATKEVIRQGDDVNDGAGLYGLRVVALCLLAQNKKKQAKKSVSRLLIAVPGETDRLPKKLKGIVL